VNLETIVREFWRFIQTKEYLDGLIVVFSEIILLLLAVPFLLHFVRRIQTRPIRTIVDFYLFQIFHKITRMFLAMASIDDIQSILNEEQKKNPKFIIYAHYIYGNLENILFVLKKIFGERDTFLRELRKKTLKDFEKYAVTCEKCMDEIDRLTTILVVLPKAQEGLFWIRKLIYPLRDLIYEITEHFSDEQTFRFRTSELQRLAKQTTERIDVIFMKRKKLIDSVIRNQRYLSIILLFISIPYVWVRRRISLRICRLRKRPYLGDAWSPTVERGYLLEWRNKYGFTIEQAAKILEMPEKDYRDYEFGYRRPVPQWERIAKHLRGEVDYSQIKNESKPSE